MLNRLFFIFRLFEKFSVAPSYQMPGFTKNNNSDLTKSQIKEALKHNNSYGNMDFKSDTVSLSSVSLRFENDTPKKIIKQW